jgi:hypothetical protein
MSAPFTLVLKRESRHPLAGQKFTIQVREFFAAGGIVQGDCTTRLSNAGARRQNADF